LRYQQAGTRVRQQVAGDRDVWRDPFDLAVIDQLLDAFTAGLPCHRVVSSS